MKIAIFDLDGTLSNADHRQHLVQRDKPDWNEFFRQAKNDPPKQDIIDLCNTLKKSGVTVVILTGRSSLVRDTTEEWLKKHKVLYDSLAMRPILDRKSDVELKKSYIYNILSWFNADIDQILFAVEDRKCVVDMWRSLGITCLQCAQGDF